MGQQSKCDALETAAPRCFHKDDVVGAQARGEHLNRCVDVVDGFADLACTFGDCGGPGTHGDDPCEPELNCKATCRERFVNPKLSATTPAVSEPASLAPMT